MNNNIKKGLITIVSLVSVLGVSANIYDNHINHVNEVCLLTSLLGPSHQIKEIQKLGLNVEKKELPLYKESTDIIPALITYDSEGNKVYIAPSGYRLNGSLAEKVSYIESHNSTFIKVKDALGNERIIEYCLECNKELDENCITRHNNQEYADVLEITDGTHSKTLRLN